MTQTTPQDILQMEQDIVLVLKNIYDPEIPVNVYDLGLIYEIDAEPDGTVTIRMTLTAPNCPVADQLVEEVRSEVAKVKGVTTVDVILTFDPPWDKSMLSEEAMLELGFL
jgi:FeS assembly SUF system protein